MTRAAQHLAAARRALARDRDPLAVHRRVAGHRAVHGLVPGEPLVGDVRVVALEHAGVDVRHVAALALVHVLRVAAAAEGLDVRVDDVVVRRGQAPREVLAAADEDVRPGARDRGAARVDARRRACPSRRRARGRSSRAAGRPRTAGARSAIAGRRPAARSTCSARSTVSAAARLVLDRLERAVVEDHAAGAVLGIDAQLAGFETDDGASGSLKFRRSFQTAVPCGLAELVAERVQERASGAPRRRRRARRSSR